MLACYQQEEAQQKFCKLYVDNNSL